MSLLGAALVDPRAFPKIYRTLGDLRDRDSAFYREAHGHIYNACTDLFSARKPIDINTVINVLRSKPATGIVIKDPLDGAMVDTTGMSLLSEVGGPQYIVELTTDIVTTSNVEAHALLILEKFIARETASIAEETKLRAFVGEQDIFETIDSAQSRLIELRRKTTQGASRHTSLSSSLVSLAMRIDEKIPEPMLETGIADFDERFGGIPYKFIVIGARNSHGKSAIALQLARYWALKGVRVGFVTNEMSAMDCTQRLVSSESGVYLSKIRKAELTDYDNGNLAKGIKRLIDAPIDFIEAYGWTSKRIYSEIIDMHVERPFGAIIVDYAQQIKLERNTENIGRDLGEEVTNLSAMRMELKIPVAVCSQLNREPSKRARTWRPSRIDLKNSANLEEAADMVLLVFRPEMDGDACPDREGKPEGYTELILDKNKEGETGKVICHFDGTTMTFRSVGGIPPTDQLRFE
jgi:replicative DNA helicase